MTNKNWPVMLGKKTTSLSVIDRGNNTLIIERWSGGLILVSLEEAIELAATLCIAVEELQAEARK